jgi:(1->4)-alpha-D-glucan 1-alpha-D-glucosylmutase
VSREALVATYRLQLGPGLGFRDAARLVPYLLELGVSHLYLSPSLQARSGSSHGYDVVDPTRLSAELGGEEGFRELARAGMPVILDVVPNHMGVGDENRWWRDPELRERWFDLDPAGGYRRFFDIDDMAAIRQEHEEVFELTHRKVLELLAEGLVSGLRVDHPDGLADPAGYLRRLAERGVDRVWVEKILHADERLRAWPVTGTVGYEFLNEATALFVDPAGREPLTELLSEVTGESRSFGEVALEAQLEQAGGTFAREVARLERLGPFDAATLADGLARLPVYRTYVEPWSGRVEDQDRGAVERSAMDPGLAAALLLERREGVPEELVARFQQTSPAIAAKGIEDTAFYRYLRLLCLNEVGGDPERFGLSVEAFHAANAERAERFPEGLLATQTHDTKRSGDSRARLGALAGIAGEWREHVLRWLEAGEDTGVESPGRWAEYLLHQTLLAAWPLSWERLEGYLVKASREAKLRTSWVEPDEGFEGTLLGYARALLASEPFRADFEPFVERVATDGERSALGQLVLKLACPGIPDIFQGDELWRLSLVDPDNRRPVDWQERRRALEALCAGAPAERATRKLHAIRAALALRRRRPAAFAGAYRPLEAGPGTCAFMRGEDVLAIVHVRGEPPARLGEAPGGRWRHVLRDGSATPRGETLPALLGDGGVALLERVSR